MDIWIGRKSQKMISKALLILVVFSMMFFLDVTLAAENNEPIKYEIEKGDLKSDSPFLDPQARVDKQAAEITKENEGEKNYAILLGENGHCASLPQDAWVLLLGAYIFLLVFNLTFEFGKRKKLQWFWEALYTILALLAWYDFDGCRQNNWFAQAVIIEGVIIYAFYFYYFDQKIKINQAQKDDPANQGKLFE